METTTTTRPRTGSRRRGIALIALGSLALLAVAGAFFVRAQLDPGAAVAGVSEVAVRDQLFAPAAIEVPTDTTVTWRWEGEQDHNVVGDGFESQVQTEGEFAQTFAEPGTYAYRCTLHFFMRGEVVVAS